MLGAIRCPLSLGIGQRLGAVLTVDNALARLTPSGSFDIMLSKSHAVGFEVCGCAGVLGIQRGKIILRAGTDTKPTDVGKATRKLAMPFINILGRCAERCGNAAKSAGRCKDAARQTRSAERIIDAVSAPAWRSAI